MVTTKCHWKILYLVIKTITCEMDLNILLSSKCVIIFIRLCIIYCIHSVHFVLVFIHVPIIHPLNSKCIQFALSSFIVKLSLKYYSNFTSTRSPVFSFFLFLHFVAATLFLSRRLFLLSSSSGVNCKVIQMKIVNIQNKTKIRTHYIKSVRK